jgi:D-alanyl-D-alanine carboxypeptidase/D-alanyl-D-alanine-endopeptidase (penicillin-binding protein 4)
VNLFVQPTSPGQLVGVTFSPFTSYIKIKNSCLTGGDNAQLSRQPDGNDLTLRGTARIANIIPYAMTVHDPALYAGTFLADTLKANGISISGDVVRDRSMRAGYAQALANHDPSWTLLAVHETSLPSVISRANKDSMNLYAECICKRLGYADTGQGTWATGTGSVAKFLLGLKISSDQFQLDDGCGLSKQNAISANLMVKVLTHDYFSKDSQTWMGCLSVAGEDGTLLDRFHGYDLKGRVIAKTGFVNKVSCLSGYLHTKDDSWYCFSILFNGIPDGTNSTAKILQEKIVHAIDANAGK